MTYIILFTLAMTAVMYRGWKQQNESISYLLGFVVATIIAKSPPQVLMIEVYIVLAMFIIVLIAALIKAYR